MLKRAAAVASPIPPFSVAVSFALVRVLVRVEADKEWGMEKNLFHHHSTERIQSRIQCSQRARELAVRITHSSRTEPALGAREIWGFGAWKRISGGGGSENHFNSPGHSTSARRYPQAPLG